MDDDGRRGAFSHTSDCVTKKKQTPIWSEQQIGVCGDA